MSKLETLASVEGYFDYMDMIEEYAIDSVVPGICKNPDCDYTTEVEPDQTGGYCEMCATQSVESCLSLAGII